MKNGQMMSPAPTNGMLAKSEVFSSFNPELKEGVIQTIKSKMFGKIRGLTREGRVLLIAHDIAKALGYQRPQNAIKTHCNSADALNWGIAFVPHKNNLGGTNMVVIGEANLYRLIMASKKPEAEAFQTWVYNDVLPAIRQTGGYIPISTGDTDAEVMAKALMIAQKTINQKDEIISEKNAKILEDKPKVDYYDLNIAPMSLYTTFFIAKCLGTTAQRLHLFLSDEGIAKWDKALEEWVATPAYSTFQVLQSYFSKHKKTKKEYAFAKKHRWTPEAAQEIMHRWRVAHK